MGVKLVYADIPPEIKSNTASVSASYEYPALSDTSVNRARNYNPDAFYKVATLEQDYWLLDGTFDLAGARNNKPCVAWSDYIGDAAISGPGYVTSPRVIYRRGWNEKYSAPGVTVVFGGDTLPTTILVQWKADGVIIAWQEYHPDKFTYFCEKPVSEFNEVVITVSEMPNFRFAKIVDVIDGRIVEFTKSDIESIRLLEELGATSENIPNNQLDVTVLQKSDLNYTFQNSQNIDVYFNDELYGNYFVTKTERSGKYKFKVTAHDYKGVLDGAMYGGNYFADVTFSAIVSEIIGDTVPYQVDSQLASERYTGLIPPGTKREALNALLLGACAVCDSSRRNHLYIFKLGVNSVTIDENNTFYGKGYYQTDNSVTSVQLTVHAYSLGDTEVLFRGTMTGASMDVKFDEPVDISTLTVSGTATLTNKSAYKCTVNGNAGGYITISGKKYKDNTSIIEASNPHLVSSMQINIREVSSNTSMVTSTNATRVLNHLINYYKDSDTLESKVHLQGEMVGDTVTLMTDWLGLKTGLIERLDYSLFNKTIGKATVHVNA